MSCYTNIISSDLLNEIMFNIFSPMPDIKYSVIIAMIRSLQNCDFLHNSITGTHSLFILRIEYKVNLLA